MTSRTYECPREWDRPLLNRSGYCSSSGEVYLHSKSCS